MYRFAYEAGLEVNLAKASLVINVFDDVVMVGAAGVSSNVTLPSYKGKCAEWICIKAPPLLLHIASLSALNIVILFSLIRADRVQPCRAGHVSWLSGYQRSRLSSLGSHHIAHCLYRELV